MGDAMTVIDIKVEAFKLFLDKPQEEILKKYREDLISVYGAGQIHVANYIRQELKDLDTEISDAIQKAAERK